MYPPPAIPGTGSSGLLGVQRLCRLAADAIILQMPAAFHFLETTGWRFQASGLAGDLKNL